jgi:uncharacterized cupredoxin-like copper-binding protein
VKKLTLSLLTAVSFMALTAAASATGTHEGYDFGEPGKAENVTQTVPVEVVDAGGDMKFVHAPLTIKKGDVVKFVVTNKGSMPHEFSVGDSPSQRAHALMMEKMPDMKHDKDATAISLAPGETKELIWAFTKPITGQIELACQVPGHYQAGMVTKVKMAK